MSKISCSFGILFVLSIAILHMSGFTAIISEFNESNASSSLKDIFKVLFILPSLFLTTLGALGVLALAKPEARRGVCLIVAAAVFACGALALLLEEWLPMAVMGVGALAFVVSALTVPSNAHAG